MNVFFDTSALFKLYHREADTEVVQQIFTDYVVHAIFLSEISKVEFASTIWKKIRMREIATNDGIMTIQLFRRDYDKFSFIEIDGTITERAQMLISRYGIDGLRTLDSLQLATAVSIRDSASKFITTDKLLERFFQLEKLATIS